MVDEADPSTLYDVEEFPLYYEGHEQFKLDGLPSSARGATADVLIPINNYSHLMYGIRVVNSYDLPAAFFSANPAFKQQMLEGGVDSDQSVFIDLAQQNVIARPMHQRTLTGQAGRNWHPFPAPYPFRGGNNLHVVLRRLNPYPLVLDGDVLVQVFPTVHVTLVCGVLVSDAFPASGAPSTNALGARRRRG